MSEEEIIRVQYEAIKKFSCGNKKLAYKVISELAPYMREYILSRKPEKVTCDELCSVIESATQNWQENSLDELQR